jgi:histidyl-tRNA synthetase
MAIQKPSIPKGTRDFSPEEVSKRQYIFDKIRHQFQLFGYSPIETPSFENLSTLTGKYGEEGDRLIFKILNSGDYFGEIRNSLRNFFSHYYTYYIMFSFNEELEDFNTYYNKHPHRKIEVRFYDSEKYNSKSIRLKLICDKYINMFNIEDIKSDFLRYCNNNNQNLDIFGIDYFQTLYNYLNENNEFNLNVIESSVNEFFQSIPGSSLTNFISEKALRYDLTVPFARYVVQHQNEISLPFKRYQMQPVWRADRPQKGRFREFYQCDADVVGSDSLLQEVELVTLYDAVFSELGVGVEIHFNNRKILSGLAEVANISDKLIDFTVALDKLDKIGEEKVKEEMLERGISPEAILILSPLFTMSGNFQAQLTSLESILNASEIGMKGIDEVRFVFEKVQKLGLKTSDLVLNLTLARGLDYYTGAILEVKAKGVQLGSIGGGGRYDDLTGIFGLKGLSGVGISFGLDRIYLVVEELNLFPESIQNSLDILFINFGDKEAEKAMELVMKLRGNGVRCEVYPDAAKMKKQMQYADKKAVKFVVIIGEEELNNGKVTLKNMESGEQSTLSFEELVAMEF